MEYYKLTNETIDMLSDKLGEMYLSTGQSKKDTYRAKLLLEEALLKYRSRQGDDIELSYRIYNIFGQTRFSLRLRSASFDPFSLEENPMSFMLQSIMTGFESTVPTWKYRNMENEIVFTVRRKKAIGSLTKIVIALAASVVLGILARLLLPSDVISTVVTDYLKPLSNAYAGVFCVMAVLLTFFAIVLSIVHIGDMASVGVIGGRMMRRFFMVSGISVIVLTLPILPFVHIGGTGTINVAAKSLYDILVGFIPTNLVSPFLNFNSVHIMLVGLMFGCSLLMMGQKGTAITEIFDECNLVAVYTNNFLNKFIFIYVAIEVFSIITTSNFSELKGAGKMVVAIIVGEIILMSFYTVYTLIKTKMSFSKYIKAMTPGFLVGLSSANFGAAFSTIFDSLIGNDVDGDTANLSVNLGSVFFQPACTLVFVFSSIFMANDYGVEMSAVWIIMAILLSVVLVFSMPNIPGASVSVITLLYAQLGIPNAALSLIITINAVLQFVTVAVDIWCLQSEIFCINAGNKNKAELSK